MGGEELPERSGGVPCSKKFEIIGMSSLTYFDSFDMS